MSFPCMLSVQAKKFAELVRLAAGFSVDNQHHGVARNCLPVIWQAHTSLVCGVHIVPVHHIQQQLLEHKRCACLNYMARMDQQDVKSLEHLMAAPIFDDVMVNFEWCASWCNSCNSGIVQPGCPSSGKQDVSMFNVPRVSDFTLSTAATAFAAPG